MMTLSPQPLAMMNHRGERIMPLPYRPNKAKKTRKISVLEGDYEHLPQIKKQRSDKDTEPELELEPTNSPFDLHLKAVYEGNAEDGLSFFQSHGYYDITDANTVEMFRVNFGLDDGFWLDKEEDELEDVVFETAVYPFGSQQIMSSRSLLRRERSESGRFALLDDDGNEVDEHMLWELEREDRLKARSLQLDDDDLAELAHDEVSMVQAISSIRTEKFELHEFFLQAFREEQARMATPVLQQVQRTELPQVMPPADVELPPYCGYVNLLKDTIPFLMRSWHKRWFYLDFQAGVVLMYKRSYWKSPRGVVDLRNVAHVEKMSQGDFRVEFHDTGADAPAMMLMRAKTPEESELWVNLMRFAKQSSSGAPLRTDTLMDNTKALMKKASKKNQVDVLAQMLQNSANNAPSSNLRAIAQASASAASAVSNRRNSKPHRHALTA